MSSEQPGRIRITLSRRRGPQVAAVLLSFVLLASCGAGEKADAPGTTLKAKASSPPSTSIPSKTTTPKTVPTTTTTTTPVDDGGYVVAFFCGSLGAPAKVSFISWSTGDESKSYSFTNNLDCGDVTFNSDFTRVAARETQDSGKRHVGYVQLKTGSFTDLTATSADPSAATSFSGGEVSDSQPVFIGSDLVWERDGDAVSGQGAQLTSLGAYSDLQCLRHLCGPPVCVDSVCSTPTSGIVTASDPRCRWVDESHAVCDSSLVAFDLPATQPPGNPDFPGRGPTPVEPTSDTTFVPDSTRDVTVQVVNNKTRQAVLKTYESGNWLCFVTTIDGGSQPQPCDPSLDYLGNGSMQPPLYSDGSVVGWAPTLPG